MICPACHGTKQAIVNGTGTVPCMDCCPREYLNEIFTYDEATGVVTRKRDALKARAGDAVGNLSDQGYLVVNLRLEGSRKPYRLHRLIWMMKTGAWPSGDIDHVNRNRSDNRWNNLRDVSRAANLRNNAFDGVSICQQTGMWRAYFSYKNKSVWVGRFETKKEAQAARRNKLKAHLQRHGEEGMTT